MRTSYRPTHRRRDPVRVSTIRAARSAPSSMRTSSSAGGCGRSCRPQGLLVVAAYLPETWTVRFVDENSRPATPEDFEWADAVFVVRHAHPAGADPRHHRAARTAHGRPAIVGGPSVSGCPEYYPDADILHVGEIGDATDRLIEHLDRTPGRPAEPAAVRDGRAAAAGRLPDAGLRADPAARVLHRQHPVLQRLPVLVRVLRHPGALRAQPAAEDRPRRCCASSTSSRRPGAPASTSSTTTSSATRRPRWSCCRTWSTGRRATSIRCASPARPRSTSPRTSGCWS